MEPLDAQDPISRLLAQARRIEARANFTPNVVRAARQTPQDRGWFAALRAWWEETSLVAPVGRLALAAAVIALAAVLVPLALHPTAPAVVEHTAPILDESPLLLPDVAAPWEAAYQTEALLAVEDTTQFTDSEISFLLY